MKNNKINLKNMDGFSLIEVVAAIAILSFVLITLLSLLLQGVKHTKFNEEKLTEVDIAEEIVGEIRSGKEIAALRSPNADYGFYTVEIVSSPGPNEYLCKANVSVLSDSNAKQKQSSFITEIYYEPPKEKGCAN